MAKEITWDEATENQNFVKLKPDMQKILVLTNWRFEVKPEDSKVAAGEIAFMADCIEEDGEQVEKTVDWTSKRLKTKLRPIFEGLPSNVKIKLSILQVGESFNTQYSVKKIEG
jgi:hypothetical protein